MMEVQSTPLPGPSRKLSIDSAIVGSPLRRSLRQSLVVQTPNHHDDESERRQRRSLADIERRVSNIGTQTPEVPPGGEKEIKRHFQLCLQMFAENKISLKNVWNLKIIDYMQVVLQSQGREKDSLQIGSTSLDVSAKVYGLRVDDVHSDGLKLAGNMARSAATRGDQEVPNMEDMEEAQKENEPPKKKKKTKRISLSQKNTIVKDLKSITGDIPKLESNFFQTRMGADTNSVDSLFTNRLPMHPCGHKFMLLSNEKSCASYDSIDPKWKENATKTYPWPLQLVPNLQICAPFAEFEIDSWDPDYEDQLIHSRMNSFNDNVVFDDRGLPVAELDGSVHDLFAINDNDDADHNSEHEEEKIEGQYAIHHEPQHIIDFRPSDHDTVCNEYSYASIAETSSNKYITQVWAGPSHWKLKYLRPTMAKFAGKKDKQQTARKSRKAKDEDQVFDFYNCPELENLGVCKPRKNPIRYDFHKITLPEVYLLEEINNNGITLLSKPVTIYPRHHNKKDKDIVEGEVEPYNYQNPSDSQYCPQNNTLTHDDNGDCFGDNDAVNDDDMNDFQDEHIERQANFMGDNLVQAPEMVQKVYVPYATNAKKMNMKKLKIAMWSCLVSDKNVPVDKITPEDLYSRPVRPAHFSEIYQRLPSLLSEKMKEELSCPLAFVALLHLTNEQTLKLTKKEGDLSDFKIEKDSRFSPVG